MYSLLSGRRPDQEGLHLHHEALCLGEDCREAVLVRHRLLPARLYRQDVQVDGAPAAGSVFPHVLQRQAW